MPLPVQVFNLQVTSRGRARPPCPRAPRQRGSGACARRRRARFVRLSLGCALRSAAPGLRPPRLPPSSSRERFPVAQR
ncbi:hypothetical protein P7K49_012151 [Saguinus oedipus]|uniref:Uncharacterized protein n=1 Tax=Saguinus oedipus TaxID=9490 RepID=A0ABQ9VU90_SAGOE|nr:hypothetical protein P7K49_012151 [Saguinus oedipus]